MSTPGNPIFIKKIGIYRTLKYYFLFYLNIDCEDRLIETIQRSTYNLCFAQE